MSSNWMVSIAAAAALAAVTPASQAQGAAPASVAELERTFWVCDHLSTHQRIDSATAVSCSLAYEALKARKFNGDFTALLAWWRENKQAEHLAIESRSDVPTRRAALRLP